MSLVLPVVGGPLSSGNLALHKKEAGLSCNKHWLSSYWVYRDKWASSALIFHIVWTGKEAVLIWPCASAGACHHIAWHGSRTWWILVFHVYYLLTAQYKCYSFTMGLYPDKSILSWKYYILKMFLIHLTYIMAWMHIIKLKNPKSNPCKWSWGSSVLSEYIFVPREEHKGPQLNLVREEMVRIQCECK